MAIRSTCLATMRFTSYARSLSTQRPVFSLLNSKTSYFLAMASVRSFSKCIITPNLKLNTQSPVTLDSGTGSLPKVVLKESRPLVVLLEYLNAKEKHIRRFIDFYLDYGFDVLQIHIKPWQLLWPTKGSQIVAHDVAKFLVNNNSFSPMVVHGFSVGGYLWGEVLVHFSKNLELYQPVINKIKCKIFDSAVDVNDIPKGFPLAVFPKNQILRNTFEKYLRYHLKTFYEESTKHYNASRKEFSRDIVKCPRLMITSNADPLSSVMVNEAVRQELATLNLECFIKVFEGSKHVAHFKKHREDYIAEIEAIFAKVNITRMPKLKAKL